MLILGNTLYLDTKAVNIYGYIPRKLTHVLNNYVKVITPSGVVMYCHISASVVNHRSPKVLKHPKKGTLLSIYDNLIITPNNKIRSIISGVIPTKILMNSVIIPIYHFKSTEFEELFNFIMTYLKKSNRKIPIYYEKQEWFIYPQEYVEDKVSSGDIKLTLSRRGEERSLVLSIVRLLSLLPKARLVNLKKN